MTTSEDKGHPQQKDGMDGPKENYNRPAEGETFRPPVTNRPSWTDSNWRKHRQQTKYRDREETKEDSAEVSTADCNK